MSLIDKTATVQYELPIEQVYQGVKIAACQIPGMYVTCTSDQTFTIYLEKGISFWSWGEKITIRCQWMNSSQTIVEVKSAPKMSTTLIDYGVGKKNVKKVIEALNNYFANIQTKSSSDKVADISSDSQDTNAKDFKYCTCCGSRIQANSSFCTHCGAKL